VSTCTVPTQHSTKKKLIYNSEFKSKLDLFENGSAPTGKVSTGSPEEVNYKIGKKNNGLVFSKNISVLAVDEFPLTEQRENLPNDNELESESEDALANNSCIFTIPVEDVRTAQRYCPQLALNITYLTTGELPEDNKKLSRQILFHKVDLFLGENNVLM